MASEPKPEFGRFQRMLWPVYRFELKKLLPMLLIFFFISLDYNILRTMKDSLVVTAKSSGAEVIPFIKVWVMFPMALVMTFVYTRLANRFSRETVFYGMLGIFMAYFVVFIAILYPLRDYLHPHASADALQAILPAGFKGLIAMYRYWIFTSFYVMAELWSNIIVFTLFWGFVNQITRFEEAKRFYGLFGIGANFSGIAAGIVAQVLIFYAPSVNLHLGENPSDRWLYLLVFLVLICAAIATGIFRWMNKNVLSNESYYDQESVQEEKQVKGRLSLRDSFTYLANSRYLLCLALIVIAYNIVINLTEVLWKHEVRELYPNAQDYTSYMYQVMTVIGVIATFASLFVSGNSLRLFGWTFTAMITPAILLITSVGFFYFYFSADMVSGITMALMGASPLAIVVFFGSAQNCVSRAAKYTVFDATKELAFVPLSAECKLKGKAAIDGVCSRLGKSGGSLIYQGLLISFSTIAASTPYVAGFILTIICAWIVAVRVLGKQFNALTAPAQTAPMIIDEPEQVLVTEEHGLTEQQAT